MYSQWPLKTTLVPLLLLCLLLLLVFVIALVSIRIARKRRSVRWCDVVIVIDYNGRRHVGLKRVSVV